MTGLNMLFLFVSGFSVLSYCLADSLLTFKKEAALNRHIKSLQRCANMNAISLALVGIDREGAPVKFTKGYGQQSPRSHSKVTSDTVFCIGECTRGFTSTLLSMLLADNGNYTWTTPLWDMLGDWVKIYDWYRTRNINLKDILTMRSGVGGLKAAITHNSMIPMAFLGRMAVTTEVMSYREHYVETEEMYGWIPSVVYKLHGNLSYDELVRQRLFEPLGMTSSMFIHDDLPRTKQVASPTIRINGRNVSVPLTAYSGKKLVSPSSSICSSANDMAKWMIFQMGDGRTTSGEVIISQRDLQNTHRFYTVRSDPGNAFVEGFRQPDVGVSYTFDSYGLGWIRGIHRGYGTLAHDGSLPGYETLMTMIPSRKIGVYTTITGMSGSEALAAKSVINLLAIDALLGGPGESWIRNPCELYNKMHKAASKEKTKWEGPYYFQPNDTARSLQEYAGTYENMALYKLTVEYNETRDVLVLLYGELGDYTLHPMKTAGVFRADAVGDLFYLTRTNEAEPHVLFSSSHGYGGEIDTVTVPFFDELARPVFVKNLRYTDRFATGRCGAAGVLVSYITIVMAFVTLLLS